MDKDSITAEDVEEICTTQITNQIFDMVNAVADRQQKKALQYYYDLLDYAQLPTNQETFDKCFQTSFNMSDERVSDYSFITVEDDRNNLFETRRNFATIAEQQGFVNVISSEYMLREYMSANTEMFTADAKAIPYITADYARTKRNAILSLCLLLCIDSVKEETLSFL